MATQRAIEKDSLRSLKVIEMQEAKRFKIQQENIKNAIAAKKAYLKMINTNEEFKDKAKSNIEQKDFSYTQRMMKREWITIGSMEKDNEYKMNKLLRRNLYHSQSKAEEYIYDLKGIYLVI